MKKHIKGYILCLFFTLFCPLIVYAEEFTSEKNGLDIMFVMDYSGSMKSNDSQDIAKGMNFFIHDEIREQKGRRVLILLFKATGNEKWLARDIVSFIVSEVQELYPEYHCEGKVL